MKPNPPLTVVTQQPIGEVGNDYPPVNVVETQPDLITGPLSKVDKFYIKSSGLVSKQVEPLDTPSTAQTGVEFLRANISNGGIRIMSGKTQLGFMDHFGLIRGGTQSPYKAYSTFAINNLVFQSRERTCCCICYCCCRRIYSFHNVYDVLVNKERVAQIRSNDEEGVVVEFQPQLRAELKALVVVGAFCLFNAYWELNRRNKLDKNLKPVEDDRY